MLLAFKFAPDNNSKVEGSPSLMPLKKNERVFLTYEQQAAYVYASATARLTLVDSNGKKLDVVRKRCLALGAVDVHTIVSDLDMHATRL